MAVALSQCPGIEPIKDSSQALQAALNLKQPIMWDCPVNCVMGSDQAKSIFVPDSDVTFVKSGRLDVDNIGFPALCFCYAAGTWRDAKIRYKGNFGVDGIHTTQAIGGGWNTVQYRNYLQTHGVNDFSASPGYVGAYWTGPTNVAAIVSIKGGSNINFLGLTVDVAADALASQFAPVAVSLDSAFGPGVAPNTNFVFPTAHFKDVLLDGVCMGFVGAGNATFENVTRRRYSDLQDPFGNNVGGIGAWFAPPHFMYLMQFNKIINAVDEGVYIGTPTRRPTTGGNMVSLKVCLKNGALIDGYYSRCLDGAMDILSDGSPTGGTIRNAFFMIDTSILTPDGLPTAWGIRFPSWSSHAYPASNIRATIVNLANAPVPVGTAPAGITTQLALEQAYGFQG
jgi:hypothetical protein